MRLRISSLFCSRSLSPLDLFAIIRFRSLVHRDQKVSCLMRSCWNREPVKGNVRMPVTSSVDDRQDPLHINCFRRLTRCVPNFCKLRTSLRILGSYLAFDICKFVSAQFPYIHSEPRPSFFGQPVLVQVVLTWLHQLEAFTFFNIPYQILAFLCVATNFQSQDDCGHLFSAHSRTPTLYPRLGGELGIS